LAGDLIVTKLINYWLKKGIHFLSLYIDLMIKFLARFGLTKSEFNFYRLLV